MKFFIKRAVFLIGLIFSGNLYAGALGTGTVTLIGGQVSSTPAIYFAITPAPTNRASCSTNASYHFVLDPTTAQGKALYSMLLTAKTTNKSISVSGTGNCILGQPLEAVSYWIMRP